MKAGDKVRVRRLDQPLQWGVGEVVLASENQKSLMLKGEDLPHPKGGMSVHPKLGRVLTLLETDNRVPSIYTDLFSDEMFEVLVTNES